MAWSPRPRKVSAAGSEPPQDGDPGHVTFYVEVDDVDAYLEKTEQLGGRTVVPPTVIEQFGLTFAFIADPEGHVIGLSKGAVQ
jgi:predicted enzyme related to lactoylglutathione lyase